MLYAVYLGGVLVGVRNRFDFNKILFNHFVKKPVTFPGFLTQT